MDRSGQRTVYVPRTGQALIGAVTLTLPPFPPTTHYAELDDYHSAIYLNRVYVCPRCGNAWARLQIANNNEWFPYRRSCLGHFWNHLELNGSVVTCVDDLFILPPKALMREVLLYLRIQIDGKPGSLPDPLGTNP